MVNMMKKMMILISIAFAIVTWFGYQSFQFVEADYQRELGLAREIALNKTVMVRINEVHSFAGEKYFHVFKGIDNLDQEVWVWVASDGETHTVFAKDSTSRDDIKQAALIHDPEAQIMRIVPGKLGNTWAWEVFYKKPSEERYYYLYYDFETGDLLRSYRLSKSIGS
jgi:uncharacterized protein YpmB